MSETAAAADAPAAAPPPPAAPKSKMIPIFLALNTLLLAGVVAALFLRQPAGGPPNHKGDEKAAEEGKEGEHGEAGGEHGGGGGQAKAKPAGPTVRLADFVVRLRGAETDRYARMGLEVELESDADKEILTANMARLRDGFIVYLSDRTLEELTGSEGLTRTKRELHEKLKETVPALKVRALFVTDFVVQ